MDLGLTDVQQTFLMLGIIAITGTLVVVALCDIENLHSRRHGSTSFKWADYKGRPPRRT